MDRAVKAYGKYVIIILNSKTVINEHVFRYGFEWGLKDYLQGCVKRKIKNFEKISDFFARFIRMISKDDDIQWEFHGNSDFSKLQIVLAKTLWAH